MSENNPSLDWPENFPRTPSSEREPYPHNFRVDTQDAFRNILQELGRMDATDLRIDSAAQHLSSNPNLPYKQSNPGDPGVVAYFRQEGRKFAVPCDRWISLRDNAQAIAKYLNAKRALDRYGVETVEDQTEMMTQLYEGD
ncbi:hypothetical protein [Halorubrum ezzemoulense]|uniref:hypothetical protein n=1 Tax=Halorubrum ezzemoulense TaxID=337243 RepID=UPI00111C5DAD|nr:hypothetical protein [Halorubrum ezzemoulense]